MITKMRVFYILIIGFLNLKCHIHHANVSGDFYGVKNVVSLNSSKEISNLPIKIEFDEKEKQFILAKLAKKGHNNEIHPLIIEGYYSEEIISRFKNSKLFSHNSNANIRIRIYSTIDEVRDPVLSFIPHVLTLGLFPAITRTYGRVEFELFDDSTQSILKTYKYPINHRMFRTPGAFLVGPILAIFSDRFDHSKNERTFAIMRVAFKQFESDLNEELNTDPIILSKFIVQKPSIYALLPIEKTDSIDDEFRSYLYTELESSFVQRGLQMVERKRLDRVFEEIKFSNSGLTENSRTKIGSLLNAERVILLSDLNYKRNDISGLEIKFSIRCVDVKSGKIFWTKNVNYSGYDSDLIYHIKSAIYPFISELRDKGDL
jgi:hypothetical protein